MPFKHALKLTIRQRLVIVMLIFFSGLAVIGAISFNDIIRIKELSLLLGEVQQLNNTLLETRRFEKNYLLYGNAEDLEEASGYLKMSRALLADITSKRSNSNLSDSLIELEATLDRYGKSIDRLFLEIPQETPVDMEEVQKIRRHGNTMISLAEGLVTFESKRIIRITNTLKLQLIMSVMAMVALFAITFKMMFGRLFSTLSIIQTATKRIAQGKFEPLPEVGGQSDTKSIIKALNAMVRELELRQSQLFQAQKLSSIGTLAAGIAHQLNNPLNNISTSSQILLEDKGGMDKDFSNKLLQNIEGETQRAKEIVQGLLEFSRERDFSLVEEYLRSVINKTIRLVSSQVPSNVDLSVDVPDGMELYLDKRQFQEALLNLIINAVHVLAQDGGSIAIKATTNDDQAVITVSDSGPGIDREIVDKIFDPFFTTKGDSTGTGLGLSIVYGVIKKHGGTISVESGEKDGGTTFVIRLPLHSPGENKANG